MSHIVRRAALQALILFSLLLLLASSAWAQRVGTKPIYSIEFKPGQKTAVVEETVTAPAGEGDMHDPGSERYSLKVRAGQTVTLEISSDTGAAIFSIATPDGEILKKAGGVQRFSGKLKQPGDYQVTVFTRQQSARFKLKVTLR